MEATNSAGRHKHEGYSSLVFVFLSGKRGSFRAEVREKEENGSVLVDMKGATQMNTPRIPSPESIRRSMDDLRSGKLSAVDYETREEVLNLAQMRIEAVLPEEVRALLMQYAPQVIEAYGLLLRWQAERETYPSPQEERSQAQEPGGSLTTLALPSSRSQRAYSESDGGVTVPFGADTDEEQHVLDTLFGDQGEESQPTQGGSANVQSRAGGLQVTIPPGQDPLSALYQAVAGPLAAMHQLSEATHQPTVNFQAGPKMALDTFQGAYKGRVTFTEGEGKWARTVEETIAVLKDIYEAEQRTLADQGNAQAVEDPAYWIARRNMMSVYLVGERPEVGWILGDYDSAFTGIPAGTRPTPEQIAAYLHDPDDDEHWYYEVIKMHLRTPQQKAWLEQHDLTLADILDGHTPVNLSPQLVQVFFQDWNAKLGEHMFGF